MIKYLVCLVLAWVPFITPLVAQENATGNYLKLLYKYADTLGPFGSSANGEMEIIRDPALITQIEAQTGRKAGIIHQGPYWILLNDPVRFPCGNTGIYGRLLWVNSLEGTPGVAVLPILPDGRIVLNYPKNNAESPWL